MPAARELILRDHLPDLRVSAVRSTTSPAPSQGPGFSIFPAMQLDLAVIAELNTATLAKHTADHLESMRLCWPAWEGPRIEDSIQGRISVNTCIVESLTHGCNRYHYMAPCVLQELEPDGQHYIAVVDYPADCHCAHMNGERLRLHITDLWPPVQGLIALRDEQERAAKASTELLFAGF